MIEGPGLCSGFSHVAHDALIVVTLSIYIAVHVALNLALEWLERDGKSESDNEGRARGNTITMLVAGGASDRLSETRAKIAADAKIAAT